MVLVAGAAALVSSLGSGCGNPVRDEAIDALGPEDPHFPVGPDHRPGQDCVICHSAGGPASGKPFAIAGTIYKSAAPGAEAAEGVTVQFVDSKGKGPIASPQTGPTGNFYVPLQDWLDLAFPIRVGLYAELGDEPTTKMNSLINREGSCNFCHRKNPDPKDGPDGKLTEAQVKASRSSAGQIFMPGAK